MITIQLQRPVDFNRSFFVCNNVSRETNLHWLNLSKAAEARLSEMFHVKQYRFAFGMFHVKQKSVDLCQSVPRETKFIKKSTIFYKIIGLSIAFIGCLCYNVNV